MVVGKISYRDNINNRDYQGKTCSLRNSRLWSGGWVEYKCLSRAVKCAGNKAKLKKYNVM